jgi:hypothetical protein
MATEKTKKNEIIYNCIFCHFNTCKKTDFTRHNTTQKHKSNIKATECNKKNENSPKYLCEICEKSYTNRTGLWRHKKTCKIADISDTEGENVVISNTHTYNELNEIKEIMKYLMKDNSEMKNIILEVVKNGINNTNNNHSNNTTNTNSHNKAFNLQFFLNETCKDAMNISEFVESIQFQLSDLERLGEIGYVEGISNIIVKNLNKLDITKRPVHCTDKKRETMYVKDENKWEKDEEQKKLRKMIKKVADKNARLLSKFTEKYPDYKNYYSTDSDKYSKIIVESMGGSGNNDLEKEDKIIRNIAKNVVVEKE